MKTVLLAFAVFGLFLAAACGGSDDTNALKTQVAALQTQVAQPTATVAATPTSEPDRVVGVTWKCKNFAGAKGPGGDYTGGNCTIAFAPNYCGRNFPTPFPPNCVLVADVVATVTVRTATGSTYTVAVQEPQSDIPLGTTWPPK